MRRTITRVGRLVETSALWNPAYPSSSLDVTRELRDRTADAEHDVATYLERGNEASSNPVELARQKAAAIRIRLTLDKDEQRR